MVHLIASINSLFWGSLLILLLVGTGIFFTIRLRFVQVRKFRKGITQLTGDFDLNGKDADHNGMSSFQALATAIAAQVGTGNLAGAATAIVSGGPGAIFWMWVTALIGSSTAFIEATLAQIHKEKDPLYGGFRGGPAYYIHDYVEGRTGKKRKCVLPAVLFAISGLICWCGISQVISNSVAASFKNAFSILSCSN